MVSILQPNPDRFVLFPLKYQTLWNMYKSAEASFWTSEELDFEYDKKEWLTLSDGQRHFIEVVLAFFAASDGIVNENLAANFMAEVQVPEARCFYGFQIMMENVHSETYSLLIESLVQCPKRRSELFAGIQTFPSIQHKAEWALKWTQRGASCATASGASGSDASGPSFGSRLVAFACVEGISFSSSFCAIFYLKKQGLLCQGLGKSNELISRDEGLHRDFACELFKLLLPGEKPSAQEVFTIIKECVDVERLFVTEALPVSLIGMNANLMCQYVEFVADSLSVALGYDKLYHATNPFEFMETISLQGKTNFFEARVSEYARAGFSETAEQKAFSLTEEF